MTDEKEMKISPLTLRVDITFELRTLVARIDILSTVTGVDERWLAIAKTHLEEGSMAVNKACFKAGDTSG